MDLSDFSLNCCGASCKMNHSYIWAIYTLKIGQYDIFMGHNFPEAFRRVNDALFIIKKHRSGETENGEPYNGIDWYFFRHPMRE